MAVLLFTKENNMPILGKGEVYITTPKEVRKLEKNFIVVPVKSVKEV